MRYIKKKILYLDQTKVLRKMSSSQKVRPLKKIIGRQTHRQITKDLLTLPAGRTRQIT